MLSRWRSFFGSFVALAVFAAMVPDVAHAQAVSPFATPQPRNAPAEATEDSNVPATPKPTTSNAPAIVASDYVPYRRIGKGSASGRVTMTTQTGKQFPADRVSIYLLPATPYTAWYVGLHDDEFVNALKRAQSIHHGGIRGMMDHKIAVNMGLSGIPDFKKPIPFTPIDDEVFRSIRVAKTDATGRYSFTGLPTGRYYVITHWPIVIDQTTAQTNGFGVGFGGVASMQSTTTVSTTFYHYLMAYAITKPIAVVDGRSTPVVSTAANFFMAFNGCGTLPCAAFAIDQWLPSEDRL